MVSLEGLEPKPSEVTEGMDTSIIGAENNSHLAGPLSNLDDSVEEQDYLELPLSVPNDPIEGLDWFFGLGDDLISVNDLVQVCNHNLKTGCSCYLYPIVGEAPKTNSFESSKLESQFESLSPCRSISSSPIAEEVSPNSESNQTKRSLRPTRCEERLHLVEQVGSDRLESQCKEHEAEFKSLSSCISIRSSSAGEIASMPNLTPNQIKQDENVELDKLESESQARGSQSKSLSSCRSNPSLSKREHELRLEYISPSTFQSLPNHEIAELSHPVSSITSYPLEPILEAKSIKTLLLSTLNRRSLLPSNSLNKKSQKQEAECFLQKKRRRKRVGGQAWLATSLLPSCDDKVRRCNHCLTNTTPQWREGPLGPKTLCNACGIRFKSGRLVPEYRPASSPSFDVSKHSNYHKRILNMRAIKQAHTWKTL
ncbi:hypothetical protein Ancab_000477 [Ancistrocladus abbreviatus]